MTWPATRMGGHFRVKHGFAFKGECFDSEGVYVLLTPGSFNEEGGYRDQGEKTKFYTGDIPEGYVLDEGDLLVAMTEQTPGLLGSSAWIPESGRLLHNQRLGRIVDLDENRLNKRFLYYLFNTKEVRDQISATATGGKVRHTAPERIAQVLIPMPPIDVQRSVAAALSAYDDLISNNRRRMTLLGEATRQLYREWFVRLRFPGHEHTRVANGVPERWERKPLGDLAVIVMGQSPKSQHYNEDRQGLPFHQGVTDFGETFVTHRIYSTALNRVAEGGDILCSVRAPVGRLNVTLDKIVIGRGLSALRSKNGHQSLLLQQLRSHFFKEDLIGGGAIFASVTKKEFSAQQLLDPAESLKKAFEEITVPCNEELRVLHLQNQQLRAARDLLLPRLMSGEIAV